MQERLAEAGKRLGEVVASFGANLIGFTVSETIKPMIIGALKDMVDDAKAEAGMAGEAEPDLKVANDVPGADETGLFAFECTDSHIIWTRYSMGYISYVIYCVRTDKEKKGGKFFALGKRYQIRFNQVRLLTNKIKEENKDNKDLKLPELPREPLYGTYCCCLTRNNNDVFVTSSMRDYIKAISAQFPRSEVIAKHFYLGTDYERAQANKAVFDMAFQATKDQYLRGWTYRRELEPFDEGEAVIQILQNVADRDILPGLYALVPNLPYACRWRMYYTSDSAVAQTIETSINAAWPGIQKGIDKAKEVVGEMVEKGAEKLVESLKPLLKKVLDVVQSKLSKKEEKKEDDKPKKAAVGDVVAQWRFERTEIGAKFHADLGAKDAWDAIWDLRDGIAQSIKATLEAKLSEAAKAAIGDAASMEIMKLILEKTAEYIGKIFRRFTSLEATLDGAKPIFAIRKEIEDNVVAKRASKEDVDKAIIEGVNKMWNELPAAGLLLFKKLYALTGDIKGEMDGMCEEAITPLVDLAEHLYQVQMRALNGVRAGFARDLQARLQDAAVLADENATRTAIREVFRKVAFDIIAVLATEYWTKMAEALTESTLQSVLNFFNTTIWPEVETPLKALEEAIPEPLKNAGLKIVPLAQTIITILITKGVQAGMTKLFIKLEGSLWTQ